MDGFVGEIRIFAGQFAPKDWAFCDGQELQISRNTALYSILGFRYGGNGTTTFCLPDLRGKAPMHFGHGPGLTPRVIGRSTGTSSVALRTSEIPAHTHTPRVIQAANTADPTQAIWANTTNIRGGIPAYAPSADGTTMSPLAIGVAGNDQPHNNMQPYLGVNYIICLYGEYPSKG